MTLNPYTTLLIISIYLGSQNWLQNLITWGDNKILIPGMVSHPGDYNLIGMRCGPDTDILKTSSGECKRQPKLRNSARVSQQRWEESYKLESPGEYFQTIQ